MNTDGPLLVRRGEAMRILGVGKRVFGQLIERREVTPRRWRGKGRAFFVRAELLSIADVLIDSHGRRRSKEP